MKILIEIMAATFVAAGAMLWVLAQIITSTMPLLAYIT